MTADTKVRAYTEQLSKRGLLRKRTVVNPFDSELIRFDCNDYLSLIGNKTLAQAYKEGYSHYPSGSGASMLLSGYHPNHKAVERAFADFLKVDDCILFSSGYAANIAVTALLGAIKSHAVIDKSVHASVYDGLHLSHVSYSRFPHNDLQFLAKQLKTQSPDAVVITEGIFSMSGHASPLTAMNKLCRSAQTPLLVDEAHSFGVLGPQGAGAVVLHQLSQQDVPLRIIPLGKAFAAQGAVVAGDKDWINALMQAGRSLIYSTAPSPALSYGLLKTLEVVRAADDRRAKLVELIAYFRMKITTSSLNWTNSSTAIQQVVLGCPHKAVQFAQQLKEQGISCSAIRAPTVARKNTGLRIVLNYNHTYEQINFLLNKLYSLDEHTLY